MSALVVLSSFIYTLSVIFSFLKIKDKCINFLPFFIVSEYFYFLGLSVFPILLVFGVVTIPDYYLNYSTIDKLSLFTPLHIIFYSFGMLLGVSSDLWVKTLSKKLIRISKSLYIPPVFLISTLTFISLSAFLFLVFTFGFTDFISTSTLRRSGLGSETVTADLAYLTNLIILGLFAICVYPYYMERKKNVRIVTLVIYIIGISVYLSTVSRNAIMQTFILTFMIGYTYNNRKFSSKIKLIVISFLAFIVLFYGKFIVDYLSAILSGQDIEFVESTNNFTNFIENFGHLFFSIDAGTKNFFTGDSIILKDVILAPLGIVPSSVFVYIGLEDLSYQLLPYSDRTDCINTYNLGVSEKCFVPPYYTGVSAYLLPLVFGFSFGFVRYSFYASVAETYKYFKVNGSHFIPILVLLYLTFENFILFIPSAIAYTVFLWILLLILMLTTRMLKIKIKI